jgi:MFS transporter, DHA2 family, methylenomycin A resistance protein
MREEQIRNGSAADSGRRRGAAGALPLVALCVGFFMVMMDVTVVNVALPNLGRELHGDVSSLQWVVDGYTLVFASLLLTAGGLGDRLGHRRAFQVGLALFVLSSLGCGLAPSIGVLIALRLLQGLAAALVVPTSLALINASYADRNARARAIGVWGGIGGVAAGAGPIVGALLTAGFSWRAVFFVNIPIGLVGLALTARHVVSPPGREGRGFDVPAQLAGVVCLAALALALIEAGRLGWTAPLVLASDGVFVVGLVVFILVERRAHSPMLPLSLFRSPTFSAATGVGMALNIGFYGELFILPLYFEQLRGYSVLLSGFAILPQPGMAALASYLGGRMTGRTGPRLPMAIGLLIGAGGLIAMVITGVSTPYAALLVPLAAIGFGTAFTMPAATAAVIEAAPSDRAGAASGALNASRQVGSLIGVALLGSLVANSGRFIPGMHVAVLIGGAAFLAGALATLLFVDRSRAETAAAHRRAEGAAPAGPEVRAVGGGRTHDH